MKKLDLHPKIATLTLVLLLAISAVIVTLPIANAQQTKATVAYLGAMPNPVGVSQQVLLHIGITESLASAEMGWEDMTVEVTRPDGTTETLGPYKTDSTGGTGAVFVPSMAGTYEMYTVFPQQTVITGGGFFGPEIEVTYTGSHSEVLELVVQNEAIEFYPGHTILDEYWSRPIDAQLREWQSISGSWTRDPDNLYAPYNDAPETAHILWAKEIATGGLAGGELEGKSYGIGDAYEGKWPSRFIIAGKLYYTEGGTSADLPRTYHCVNLQTGEEIWSRVFMNNETIDFAQILYWDGMNYHGAFPYLYVETGGGGGFFGPPTPMTWNAFDAYSGDWRFSITNVPAGTRLYDENNQMYILQTNTAAGWMALWSMTELVIAQSGGFYGGSWGNSAHGNNFDAADGSPAAAAAWLWNVSIPSGLVGSVQAANYGDRVIGGSISTEEVTLWGLSLADGDEGEEIFNNTWDAPAYWSELNITVSGFAGGWVAWSFEDKVAVLYTKETREEFGFSLETGDNIWGPTDSEHYLNALEDSSAAVRNIAYGNLYSVSVSGIVYCYDVQTGNLKWTYEVNDPYSEMLWSNNWWVKPLFISDGKIYISHTEHSPIDPRPRGAPFVCLDALTGDVVFRIDGAFRTTRWGGRGIIGDSIIALMDTYDQRIYAIGKGPTDLTVESPKSGITAGSMVTLTGTVMDISPGTQSPEIAMRFPKGVPAIADQDMSAWMKYVYKQFERPTDINGVSVKIEIVDPNGEYAWIGTATTDVYGSYGYSFRPQIEGQYMIIATFEGSEAYYGSTSITYFAVDPAPTPATPIEPEPETPEVPIEPTQPVQPEAPLITTEIAVIIAVAVIAVIGVAVFVVLRRRK
ncbi:MAG: PQQ-binding-like beta-propeller repeat protein [Candidatus Bathyarchaeum tardum]|nr:MAG: PQQ-binding-like beta-propeller repeat protein [Candidatus Bathyarchaeum tardum]